ncbi:MAG: cation:proton antiporter, partial [archaeon]|nr:cation:proton antiporter [archaeon]
MEAQGSHLSRLLLQLLLILGTPRVLHYFLLQHLWQPRVVSEILSGIILGPTVMGKIPGWMTYVFPDFSISTLSTISSLGLVMFLYMVGLGINSNLIEQEAPFVFGAVGLSAAFCMMFAPPLTFLFWKPEGESEYSRGTYAQTMLWVAVLLGITATGVLARILAERGILAKRLGGVAMATTAIN